MNSRLSSFSDAEIYILKRTLLEGRCTYVYSLYGEKNKSIHDDLLKEFINEDSERLKHVAFHEYEQPEEVHIRQCKEEGLI